MASSVSHNRQLLNAALGGCGAALTLPEKTPPILRLGTALVAGGVVYAAGEPGNKPLRLVVSAVAGAFAVLRTLPNDLSGETKFATGTAVTFTIYNVLSPGNNQDPQIPKQRSRFWGSGSDHHPRRSAVAREGAGDNHINRRGPAPYGAPHSVSGQQTRERVGSS